MASENHEAPDHSPDSPPRRDLGDVEGGPRDDAAAEPAIGAWLRVLLDPRSIERLLVAGGCLSILGLIATLVSLGVFEDPRVVALALVSATLFLLGAGWGVTLRSRYHRAGQAITFLACVAAPLNLWYLDWQGIVTVDGHLWVGGLVCCLAYAATVVVLRNPVFFWAVEVGVTLTTLLLLGDLGRGTDSAWVCIALLGLAAISIHAERAFAIEDPVYDRRRFGRPLFLAGQVQLLAAAIGLLGLQLAAWFVPDWTVAGWALGGSRVATAAPVAAGLWLAAAYLWVISSLEGSDRPAALRGAFSGLAATAVLLAGGTILEDLVTVDLLIPLAAAAGLVVLATGRACDGVAGSPAFRTIGRAWRTVGLLMVAVAAMATIMQGIFRLVGDETGLVGVGLLPMATAGLAALAAFVAVNASQRRFLLLGAGQIVGVTGAGWVRLLHLQPAQAIELGATAAGLLLLATGCSWRVRERPGQRDAGVGFLLSVGSLVAAGPVLWNVLGNRWSGGRPVLFDEMLLVTALLPLVVIGCGVRIRSAALVGVGGMAIYLLTLFANLVYRPELAVGIYLGVGGLMIFLIGIALSVWRDRILEIPGRIASRRGIFQVIDWR
ncbi:MAG: hypothetical protein EXS06_00220 [Planctomycetaceae bacterium]|nr:hypothetical protein [Planctomycetaceae bacterium]